MRKKLSQLLRDPFIVHNIVFFAGSIVVAFLNYLYHPVLSRFLSIEHFGDLETVLAIIAQIGIVSGIFSKVAINTISNSISLEDDRKKLSEQYTLSFIIIGGFAALILVLSPFIASSFQFQSVLSVVMLSLLTFLGIPLNFQLSVLQGVKDFKTASIVSALSAIGKLILGVGLVFMGFGVAGAIFAIAITQLIIMLYSYSKTFEHFSLKKITMPSMETLKKDLPYAVLIFATSGLVATLFNSDIIVVKQLFDPIDAGFYSGVSTIANILFFATSSVAAVLLPSILLTHTFAQNAAIFIKAIVINLFIGGAGLFLFWLFPEFFIRLLIGAKYVPFAHYLAPLSLMIFLVSFINLFISYFLALREYRIIGIAVIGLLTLGAGLYLSHGTIGSIIVSYSGASIVTLLMLGLFYIYTWRTA